MFEKLLYSNRSLDYARDDKAWAQDDKVWAQDDKAWAQDDTGGVNEMQYVILNGVILEF